MNLTIRGASAAILSAALLLPCAAQATNGYFLIGYGAKSRAMGGIGVARGMDGLAAAFNPATMTDVADTYGIRLDLGGDIFRPNAAVYHDQNVLLGPAVYEEPTSPSTAFSKNGNYLLPALGVVYKLDDVWTVGFAMVGNGAATEYDQTVPAGASSYFFNFNGNGGSVLGVKLINIQMLPSIAYKMDKQHSFGATFVLAYSLFEGRGFGAFDSSNLGFGASAGALSDQGTDTAFGYGIRLGWKGKFLDDKLHAGFNYSSRTYMDEFEKYRNLFAEQGDFDIPSTYTLGVAYTFTPEVNGYFEYMRINYTDVASVSNGGPVVSTFDPLFPCGDITCGALGADQGLGFGWTDADIFKLGAQFAYSPQITLRAGFNHADSVIPNNQVHFGMVAPATVEDHLTLGGSYKWSKDIEVSASYVHAFENTITGPTRFQPPGADPNNPVNDASIAMKQNSIGVMVGIQF